MYLPWFLEPLYLESTNEIAYISLPLYNPKTTERYLVFSLLSIYINSHWQSIKSFVHENCPKTQKYD